MKITQEELKAIIQYDPNTGDFTWLVSPARNVKAGALAGTYDDGYKRIGISGKYYRTHRLAWLYVHGKWPENQIDHINGIRDDNRICNLRDVSHGENQQNRKAAQKNSKTGFLGVMFFNGKYKATVAIPNSKKDKYLGVYGTPEEAHEVYLKAKRELHEGCTI